MGLKEFFKLQKSVPIITAEDNAKLRELQRSAYMEEAEKIIKDRGKAMAHKDLDVKKDPYSLN